MNKVAINYNPNDPKELSRRLNITGVQMLGCTLGMFITFPLPDHASPSEMLLKSMLSGLTAEQIEPWVKIWPFIQLPLFGLAIIAMFLGSFLVVHYALRQLMGAGTPPVKGFAPRAISVSWTVLGLFITLLSIAAFLRLISVLS